VRQSLADRHDFDNRATVPAITKAVDLPEILDAQSMPQHGPSRPVMIKPSEQSRGHNASTGDVPLKLSILMPAYNEEKTIAQEIEELLRAKYPCNVEPIVVENGSTDQRPAPLAQVNDPRVIVHRHLANLGKGAGLVSALSLATGSHILPFDADLEYSSDDIQKMLAPVVKGRCSVEYGARLFDASTVYQSYRYAKGNRVLTRLANLLFDACLSDLHTCLKLMPLAMMRSFNLREAGFGLDTELTALLLRRGIRPFEVPVSCYGRSRTQGKKITWRDAAVCVWVLLRVRLRSRSSLTTSMRQSLTGIPGTVIETMAMRLGIIASDILQVVEILGNVNWPLVPPDYPLALASALASVLRGDPLNDARRDAGEKRFRALFTTEAASEGLVKLYQDVLTEDSLPPARNDVGRGSSVGGSPPTMTRVS
jgi:hypothetical protein